ncbi:MAG: hypothetical protein HW419_4734 [Deltaproteobacteria bacterium]|nr:hypothetical protein [Deltaproteobacteria bacterium]
MLCVLAGGISESEVWIRKFSRKERKVHKKRIWHGRGGFETRPLGLRRRYCWYGSRQGVARRRGGADAFGFEGFFQAAAVFAADGVLVRWLSFEARLDGHGAFGKIIDAENFNRFEHELAIVGFVSHFVGNPLHDPSHSVGILFVGHGYVDDVSGPVHGGVGERIDGAVGQWF